MVFSKLLRVHFILIAGILSPLLLTQCKSTAGKTYKDVKYDPAKLKTPTGHGLERNDYPFDESGAYRKDWVKGDVKGRDRSAAPRQESAPALASTESTPPSGTSNSVSYPTYAEASASRNSDDFVGPAGDSGASIAAPLESAGASPGETVLASAPISGSPPTAQPKYHKVSSGDTLFSLASRYKTSVPEIKRINGLTGDSIRTGQSLRIP